MIIRITNRCHMGCKHCMIDASGPAGAHMTMATFLKAMRFGLQAGAPTAVISGGEPTEHPQLFEYLDVAQRTFPIVIVASNGMFDRELADRLARCDVFVQITNDPCYYPRPLDRGRLWGRSDRWAIADHVEQIFPCRRAAEQGIEATKQYPGCVNLRHAVRRYGLRAGLAGLAISGKHCPPSIDVDGTIRAGETDTCHVIGQVGDPVAVVEERLQTMRCNVCGLRDNLKAEHLALIGESS